MTQGLPDKPPPIEQTEAAFDAIYNWNYASDLGEIRSLYANALDRQWIAVRDLDWERGIDREAFARTFSVAGIPIQHTAWWKHLDTDLKWRVASKSTAFLLSNFLHGEQGALMVAAQLVNACPHMDAKFYAATQTMDEARHVEVFAAYIKLLDQVNPIMPGLKKLLDTTLASGSWMHKAVGMQIVVEGLALYVFRDMRNATDEPLLKQLLTYVSRDEARHTAFGVKYLSAVVDEISPSLLAELEDFAFEATRLLVDSRTGSSMRQSVFKIWQEVGLEPKTVFEALSAEREKMDAAAGGVAGPVRGFVIPTLRSIGLFSDRIEGHFREMFAANFGKERAAAFDLSREFPPDLEAWLEAGSP